MTTHTAESLARDLCALGLPRGAVVLVHTSLSAIGWVEDGPATVITALRRAVGEEGTMVMPTHTTNLTDPGLWRNPPAPPEQWERIRAEMPPYDPATSPTRGMGFVAETFWRMPGVLRSPHPITSVAAQGPQAVSITSRHGLDVQGEMGLESPFGRIYELDGWVLLLGVDMTRNTSVHLAEVIAEVPYWHPFRIPMQQGDQKAWVEGRGHAECSNGFERLTPLLDAQGIVRYGKVGDAPSRLMRQRALVDTAVQLLRQDPLVLLCPASTCETCDRARAFLGRQPSYAEAAAWVWSGGANEA